MLLLASMLVLPLSCSPKAADGCTSGLDADGDGVCDRDAVDWSEEAWVEPGSDRGNIYGLSEEDLAEVRARGLQHAYTWPVSVTGLKAPYQPLFSLLEDPANDSLDALLDEVLGFSDLDDLYTLLDLAPFPDDDAEGIYALPRPPGAAPGDPIGVAVIATEQGDALNFSCAVCHTGKLFGRTVMGMSSRRAEPNAFFHLLAGLVPVVPVDVLVALADPTEGEIAMYEELQEALPSVGTLDPQVLGLDTSLAQVGMSLARRSPDAWATFSDALEDSPATSGFETDDPANIADSKPMVWWTMKYKTRWLADGSVVSGNPILTNFLWNEIGRGTDLEALEDWLAENQTIVDELTVAVFATEPPRWTDFFEPGDPTRGIDEDEAVAGQVIFEARCSGCHGVYEKAWDSEGADDLDAAARLETTRVVYHGSTPRHDVGTDSGRARGMANLEGPLNGLAISEAMDAVIRAEDAGYVPPPLDGIWARYPYLHNNSVPTLCDLLRPAAERPERFYQGPAEDPATDFDAACVGYPTGDAIPESWEDEAALMDTTRPGLSNAGHEEVLLSAGGEPLTDTERGQLVMFLKTL